MGADEDGWMTVAKRGELAAGDVLGLDIAGRQVALYDADGNLYATDNICTHAYACLSDGWLDGDVIECPLHAARFDVKTGKALSPPATEDLKTYPVRLVDDEVQIRFE